jgi:hypothetical protein
VPRARRRHKKKPGVKTPGWEALLLSHIKAPAQGGKAGSGKPLRTEFNKGKTSLQAMHIFFIQIAYSNSTNVFVLV